MSHGAPIRFTQREIDLAHALRQAGLHRDPGPGIFVYDDQEHCSTCSAVQPHVYFIDQLARFERMAGSADKLRADFTWLPTWEEGRAWLKAQGMSDAEILDRIRESIVDLGMPDREALYQVMLAALRRAH